MSQFSRRTMLGMTAAAPALARAPAPSPPPLAEPPTDDRRAGEERRSTVGDASLRVDVSLLDKLMNLVGELVLARNQILQFTTTQKDPAFVGAFLPATRATLVRAAPERAGHLLGRYTGTETHCFGGC